MPTQTAFTTPPAAALPTSIERTYRERLLRADDVCHLTGLGRSTLYAKVKAGDFPGAVQLHGACVAWRESEVDAWIAARPAAAVPAAAPASKVRKQPARGAA